MYKEDQSYADMMHACTANKVVDMSNQNLVFTSRLHTANKVETTDGFTCLGQTVQLI